MFPVFQIRRNSLAPYLEVQVNQEGFPVVPSTQGACGKTVPAVTPIDLTGATVRAKMAKCGRSPTDVLLQGEAVVSDGVNGIVQYKWATPDTNTPGGYYFWFEIEKDGSLLVWPYQREALMIEVTS